MYNSDNGDLVRILDIRVEAAVAGKLLVFSRAAVVVRLFNFAHQLGLSMNSSSRLIRKSILSGEGDLM